MGKRNKLNGFNKDGRAVFRRIGKLSIDLEFTYFLLFLFLGIAFMGPAAEQADYFVRRRAVRTDQEMRKARMLGEGLPETKVCS
jgi:hypothetical protein